MYRERYALGPLTDYRVELHLALERALAMVSAKEDEEHILFIGTPIDNFVHATLNYSERSEAGTVQENLKWYLTLQLLFTIILDSFQAEKIFFLPMKERTDDYVGALDLLYDEAFVELGIDDFIVLDGTDEQDADLCAKMIREIQEAELGSDDNMGTNSERAGSVQSSSKEESAG